MSDQSKTALETPVPAPGAACPTVLVIDDEPIIRQSLEILLESYGYQVALARDGAQGLAAFRRIRPDLVLTDIVMPNQDGIETILAMRRERPGAKIIAMSGRGLSGNTEYIDIASRLGANAAIPKPLEAVKLIATVQALVAEQAAA
ncbi:MAG TPA: response regulator [Stellaceae bacterium]|nr:response regulator [Stellaceae bacterium]